MKNKILSIVTIMLTIVLSPILAILYGFSIGITYFLAGVWSIINIKHTWKYLTTMFKYEDQIFFFNEEDVNEYVDAMEDYMAIYSRCWFYKIMNIYHDSIDTYHESIAKLRLLNNEDQ